MLGYISIYLCDVVLKSLIPIPVLYAFLLYIHMYYMVPSHVLEGLGVMVERHSTTGGAEGRMWVNTSLGSRKIYGLMFYVFSHMYLARYTFCLWRCHLKETKECMWHYAQILTCFIL